MRTRKRILTGLLACGVGLAATARADERLFTYTYEPETMPKGAFEFEQWVTSRVGRNATVGQDDYYRLQFREEFEYGLTDNYTLALYVNHDYEHFKDPGTGERASHYRWSGISLENKYMVVNPADHCVGLTLYLEPTYDVWRLEVGAESHARDRVGRSLPRNGRRSGSFLRHRPAIDAALGHWPRTPRSQRIAGI